jgi:lysophospholipase L1-like esterase
MTSRQYLNTMIAALAVLAGSACSSGADSTRAAGGSPATGGTAGGATLTGGGGVVGAATGGLSGGASGGSSSGGAIATGGGAASGSGGITSTGGTLATGGSPGSGGTTGVGGSGSPDGGGGAGPGDGGRTSGGRGGRDGGGGTGGRTGTGATGGGTSTGGATGDGGSDTGGRTGSGGTTGAGGTGGLDAGTGGLGGSTGGAGGTTGGFDPCPASGVCKILPLGDSITWGVNYDGGYRVRLFSNAVTDKKNVTYVGKLSNGPSTVSGVAFPKNNEGHSGWTLQQIDDIVTGKSTDSNYNGKKMMVDQAPNIVLLHAGTNDTSRSPTGMSDRLGTLIDDILADGPNVLLVVTTIIPIKQGSYGTVAESFNQEVPAVVKKRIDAGKHVILVDMFKDFPNDGLSGDGVHPNQTGYDWMAGVWYEAIKGYLH